MVTVETALMLAHLHRERDATKTLIATCEDQKDKQRPGTWEATFEDKRQRPNLNCGRYIEMRIPSGQDDSSCIMPRMVSPALGLAVLRAHIADVEARIVAVNEMIRAELDTPSQATTSGEVVG